MPNQTNKITDFHKDKKNVFIKINHKITTIMYERNVN